MYTHFVAIRKNNGFLIPPLFNTDVDFLRNSTDFSEGLAAICEGLRPTALDHSNFVYIDKSGAVVLPTEFFSARPFHEGLASVWDRRTKKSGFINKSGEVAIPLQYNGASDFSEGMAHASVYDEEAMWLEFQKLHRGD